MKPRRNWCIYAIVIVNLGHLPAMAHETPANVPIELSFQAALEWDDPFNTISIDLGGQQHSTRQHAACADVLGW